MAMLKLSVFIATLVCAKSEDPEKKAKSKEAKEIVLPPALRSATIWHSPTLKALASTLVSTTHMTLSSLELTAAAAAAAGTDTWNDSVCIVTPPTMYHLVAQHNRSCAAARSWCVLRAGRGKHTEKGAPVVVFPLDGASRTRDFHPFHNAMRLWWLLEFAIAARHRGQRVFTGDSWPWRSVGPLGDALITALKNHGVQAVPQGFVCPACEELRISHSMSSPFSHQFMSMSLATNAVWKSMRTGCHAHDETSSSPRPLRWWMRAKEDALTLPPSSPESPAEERTDPEDRVVLLDRSPPRSLKVHGTVRRPVIREVNAANDKCETVRQWSQPALAFLVPHGAQLNNRLLMTQQPQPCLIEVFPEGYFNPCYVLPFCPQRHVQVHGSRIWDAHRREHSADWKLAKTELPEACAWRNISGYACRAKARSQMIHISNHTLEAALELCRHAYMPSECKPITQAHHTA